MKSSGHTTMVRAQRCDGLPNMTTSSGTQRILRTISSGMTILTESPTWRRDSSDQKKQLAVRHPRTFGGIRSSVQMVARKQDIRPRNLLVSSTALFVFTQIHEIDFSTFLQALELSESPHSRRVGRVISSMRILSRLT